MLQLFSDKHCKVLLYLSKYSSEDPVNSVGNGLFSGGNTNWERIVVLFVTAFYKMHYLLIAKHD